MAKETLKKDTTKIAKPAEKDKSVKSAPIAVKPKKPLAAKPIVAKPKRYFEAVGSRKTASARVRLYTARPLEEQIGRIIVNNKDYKEYFASPELQQIVEASLNKLKSLNRFEVSALVRGGGLNSQAEAIRHGLGRTLVMFNLDFRKKLKRAGYLKRDPRKKERKKYGLKKARRAPQWTKR